MNLSLLRKTGGVSLIAGSLLLAVYSVCFFTILPLRTIRTDYVAAVLHPLWITIAVIAFFGIVLMMFGFTAVYSKLYNETGGIGFVGYCCIEIAYLIQACKVTWEFCLYPVIARHATSAFLLAQPIIKHSAEVTVFRMVSMVAIFIGTTLFCIALLRSVSFPKWAAVLIFTGAILYGIGPMVSVYVAMAGIVIFSAGCLQTGIRLIVSPSA